MSADILSGSIEAHLQRFLDYADSFKDVPDAAPLRLKVEHTLKVFEHARRIVESLGDSISPELGRASVLAALYHDCGRFPQFKEYRT
ncbi:MAG: HD domain-containing protein, partial [Mailhella sp.]|nr:HD domain-containing protein [Mailhella sp.]